MVRRSNMQYIPRRQNQSGQIGIIIILIMIVMLTIGLSLVAQSSINLSLSTQEEQSTRVFNAAEAGVEQALSTDFSTLADTYTAPQFPFQNSNANVNYTITKKHILDTRVFQGDTATVQLWDTANKQTVSSLTIDWASGSKDCSTSPQPASLIVSTYSIDPVTKAVSVRHDAFAVCDHKDNIATVGTGSGYQGEKVLTVNANDAFMRIKPVYNDTVLHVTGSGLTNQLPVQYYSILSTAQNSSGNETRAVQVNRTLSVAPYIMDYALFSGTTLVK